MQKDNRRSESSAVHLGRSRALCQRDRTALKVGIRRVLEDHGHDGSVSVVFVTDEEIRVLHREYLGSDSSTDVLSFSLGGPEDAPGDRLLGEVVVSVDTARRVAARRKVPVENEIALYAIHGTLHLLGYDDGEPRERRRMRRAERKYLEASGFHSDSTRPGCGRKDTAHP